MASPMNLTRGPQAPFTLFPAIDLKDGQAVRLTQGRFDAVTVYEPEPGKAAQRWIDAGAQVLHVVDLDGALGGTPANLPAIAAIVAAAGAIPVQLGGGLRSLQAIEAALNAGVARCIIGTKALDGTLVQEALHAFGPERIVVGIDAKNGFVATQGWLEVTEVRALDLATRLAAAGVREFIYTDIAKDGMMSGPNFAEMARMTQSGAGIIASGGVSSLADIAHLQTIPGVSGAILGKALYTGALDLAAALAQVAAAGGVR